MYEREQGMVESIHNSLGGFSSYYSISQNNSDKSSIGVFSAKEQNSFVQGKNNKQDNNSEKNISTGAKELTEEEKKEVEKLKKRDAEVKQHEQAHVAAAGPYAKGGPKYEYETGPDGQQYANAGHVTIDTSKEDDPKKNLEKAQVVKRAALAPANPSAQDKKVAAKATQMEAEARLEISKEESGILSSAQDSNPLAALNSSGINANHFTKGLMDKPMQENNPFDYQKRFSAYTKNQSETEQNQPSVDSSGGNTTETFES